MKIPFLSRWPARATVGVFRGAGIGNVSMRSLRPEISGVSVPGILGRGARRARPFDKNVIPGDVLVLRHGAGGTLRASFDRDVGIRVVVCSLLTADRARMPGLGLGLGAVERLMDRTRIVLRNDRFIVAARRQRRSRPRLPRALTPARLIAAVRPA